MAWADMTDAIMERALARWAGVRCVVMKPASAIVQLVAENVRAEILSPVPALRLDPLLVEKIRQRVAVFQGMSPECLARTLALAEHCAVPAGQCVFLERESGDAFYVLVAGEVVVEKMRRGKALELARLGPGECFGEMALVGARHRSATVRARLDSIAIRFQRAVIDAHPQSAHIIYRNIGQVLATRLKASSEVLADYVLRAGD